MVCNLIKLQIAMTWVFYKRANLSEEEPGGTKFFIRASRWPLLCPVIWMIQIPYVHPWVIPPINFKTLDYFIIIIII